MSFVTLLQRDNVLKFIKAIKKEKTKKPVTQVFYQHSISLKDKRSNLLILITCFCPQGEEARI